MDEALKRIYAACNPEKPASPQYYVEADRARGESGLANDFFEVLDGASQNDGDFIRYLFTGHIGCGKSSELAHLSYLLKQKASFHPAYLPIMLDVSDYLDDYDVTMTDLLLAVVTETAATLREELDYELKDPFAVALFKELKQFYDETSLSEAEFELSKVKLKFQRLKGSPTARQQVRQHLQPLESRLVDEVNNVLSEARTALATKLEPNSRPRFADIVLIFDNLEKIQRFENHTEGLASHRELFLERSAQFTRLQAHTIYTLPLRLARSVDGSQLAQRYCAEPWVLPMVKIFQRDSQDWYQPGFEAVKQMLEKRLAGLTLEQAFTPEALEFLLRYSGGHTRNLIRFVRDSCPKAKTAPISLWAVQQAVQRTATTFATTIPEPHWKKLAQLELSDDQQIVIGDEDYLKMLEILSVLEYVNGGDETLFEKAAPWYAVNPIVRELPKFKEAVSQLKAEREKTEQEQEAQ